MRAMGRLIICLFMSGSYSGSYIKKPTFINTPGSTSSHQSWPWTTGIPFSGQGCPVLLHLQWGKPYGGAVRVSECWCIRSRTMKAQCWATFPGDPGSQAASLLGLSRGPWRENGKDRDSWGRVEFLQAWGYLIYPSGRHLDI